MLNVAKELIIYGASHVVFLFLFIGGWTAVLLGVLLLAGYYMKGEILMAITGLALIPSGLASIGAAPRAAFSIDSVV